MRNFANLHVMRAAVFLALPLAGVALALAGGACGDDGTAGASSTSSTGGGSSSTSTTGTGMGGGATTTGTGTGTGGSTGVGGSIDCGPGPSDPAPPLKLTQVAGGLNEPLLVTGAPGDSMRLFIVERNGVIKILSGGSVLATPFLDINSIVADGSGSSEQGLLGLAFHPNYAQNGRFFVFYVANNGDSILAEYARSANPDIADPSAKPPLLTITGGGGNHFGGMIGFGPDGYLYVSSGDRGVGAAGQEINDPRGKLLRLDVDAHPAAPDGNVPGGNPYVWDYGLRNAWRFSFDRCSGDVYISDVGGMWEEVNFEPAGQGNKNYGWDTVDTGTDCNGATCPIFAHDHSFGNSIIGGYVYRGSVIPGLNGRYLYGDYTSARIGSFVMSGGMVTSEQELTADLDSVNTLVQISSFGEDTAGNLYVIAIGSANQPTGRVYRIDPE